MTSTAGTAVLHSNGRPGAITNTITAATLEDGTSVMDDLSHNWSELDYYERRVSFPKTGKQKIIYWYKNTEDCSLRNAEVFRGLNTLLSLELGNAYKTIYWHSAFTDSSALSSITMYGVTSCTAFLGFSGCTNLLTFKCYMEEQPSVGEDFRGIGNNGTLYYPEGSDYSSMLARLNSSTEGYTTGWEGVPMRTDNY